MVDEQDKKRSPINPDDFTWAPMEKCIVIIKDSEKVFIAMPEEIIKRCNAYDRLIVENRWIPVEEEMPNFDVAILVYMEDTSVFEVFSSYTWNLLQNEIGHKITHWKYIVGPEDSA